VSGQFGFQVGSGIGSSSVGSFRVSSHIRSGIRSSSVGSFRVSGRIRSGCISDYLVSGHFGFQIVSGPDGSDGFARSGQILPPLDNTVLVLDPLI
jgi:hypothetical protein